MSTQTTAAVAEAAGPSPDALDRLLCPRCTTRWRSRWPVDRREIWREPHPVACLLRHAWAGMACRRRGHDGKMSFLMERLGGRVLAVDGVGKGTVPALLKAYGRP